MNNEPVAWMLADKEAEHIRSIMAVQHDFVPEGCVEIPLYTHPVKELTAQEVMEQTHRKISEAHWKVKELTDEEIVNLYKETEADNGGIREFARAILRKAQEK